MMTLCGIRMRCLPVMALVLGLLQCHFSAHADELVFVKDLAPYCPYAGCGKGKDDFVPDIVNAIYRAKGYTVKIENVPWSRALSMVQEGNADGVLNVVPKSAPQLRYPQSEVAQFMPVVFALKSNPWRYTGIESFQSVRLGLIQGYGYEEDRPEFAQFLRAHPQNMEWVVGDDPLLRIFEMMKLGRVDATMEDQAVAIFVLSQSNMQGLFKVAGPFGKSRINTYVAFNPKKPHAQLLANIFDQGLMELRRSGKLKTILASYGVTDWK